MASELENTIRHLESMACSCDKVDGMVCDAHKVVQHLRELLKTNEDLVTASK